VASKVDVMSRTSHGHPAPTLGVALAVCAVALGVAQTRTPDIHYTPTRHAVVDVMLQLAQVGPSDVVYDLGSGDGRIPIIAAQKYGARGVGVEIDPRLVGIARDNARDAGVTDRVTFVEGDLFAADLSRATVVTLYLSASVNARLEPKLKAELRPGARVVSHQFPIGRWPPEAQTRPDFSDIFLWRIPR
jgi:SAM-dependent methyltransferase